MQAHMTITTVLGLCKSKNVKLTKSVTSYDELSLVESSLFASELDSVFLLEGKRFGKNTDLTQTAKHAQEWPIGAVIEKLTRT